MPNPTKTIPVWIEAIVTATVTPNDDGSIDPTTDFTDVAQAMLPGADIVTACTIDRVTEVLDDRAAEAAELVAEVRRLLTNTIQAAEAGFATPAELLNAIRNIRSTIPAHPDVRADRIADRVVSRTESQ